MWFQRFGVNSTPRATNRRASNSLLGIRPQEVKHPQKVFDHSFFWDEGVLCQEPPQSCYDRCCRAKNLTKGSFFLRHRPGASAALVLDVLTYAYEDEILWCRLSVALLFVAVIHDDDATGRERRRGEEEQTEMEDGTRRTRAHLCGWAHKGVWRFYIVRCATMLVSILQSSRAGDETDRCLRWKNLLSNLVICDAESIVNLLNIKKSSLINNRLDFLQSIY